MPPPPSPPPTPPPSTRTRPTRPLEPLSPVRRRRRWSPPPSLPPLAPPSPLAVEAATTPTDPLPLTGPMNWLDFSVMTPGSYPAGGWKWHWLDGTWYTTHDPPTDDVYARIQASYGNFNLLVGESYAPYNGGVLGLDVASPDVEVLTLVSNKFNLVLCGHDDVATKGKALIVQYVGNEDKVTVTASNGGPTTDPLVGHSDPASVFTATYGGSMSWVRVRVEGDTIRVKLWGESGPEPDEWFIDVTSTKVSETCALGTSPRFIGFKPYTNSATGVRSFGWALGGAAVAPPSPPGVPRPAATAHRATATDSTAIAAAHAAAGAAALAGAVDTAHPVVRLPGESRAKLRLHGWPRRLDGRQDRHGPQRGRLDVHVCRLQPRV